MNQSHQIRFFLVFFFLLACVTPDVSAFTVSSFTRNPQEYQAPASPMAVDFAIDFSPAGSVTFPPASELQMSTNLVDPHWDPILVLDGVETRLGQENGETLVISGWYLSYPSTQHAQLRVKLTGNVPASPSPGQNLLKIQEMDSSYRVVATARVEMPKPPVMTLSTPTKTPATKLTTKKIFTPYPTDTPTQETPSGIETGIIATVGAALLVIQRK